MGGTPAKLNRRRSSCRERHPLTSLRGQSASSAVTPTSRAPSSSSRRTSRPPPPSPGTSRATMPTPSAACTSTLSATTPTAAPPPALTVSTCSPESPPSPSPRPISGADPLRPSVLVNPHGKTHGAPSDEERHVGDLGNIETDAQGNSKGSVKDSFVKVIGPNSVVGVRQNDLPRKNSEDTDTGDSAPSSSTPAPTISARVATRRASRLATPAPAPLAVGFQLSVYRRGCTWLTRDSRRHRHLLLRILAIGDWAREWTAVKSQDKKRVFYFQLSEGNFNSVTRMN